MSWRAGGKIFWEILPIVRANEKDAKSRREFLKGLLTYFMDHDVSRDDLENQDPEIDELLNEIDPLL